MLNRNVTSMADTTIVGAPMYREEDVSRAQLPAAGEYASHVRHEQTFGILRSCLWGHGIRLTRCGGSRVVGGTFRRSTSETMQHQASTSKPTSRMPSAFSRVEATEDC
jgi:hypothetical protein